jgi:Ca-activated chloride channel family protein
LAKELHREKGISVFCLGVGTPEGSDIRDAEGEKVDKSGRTVITKLDESFLRQLALTGGGQYFSLGNERFDVAALAGVIDSIEKSGLLLLRPESLLDRYPFFVFMAFLFFTLALWIQEKKS